WISSLAACLEGMKLSMSDAINEAHRIVATIQGGIVLARATAEPDVFHLLIEKLRLAPESSR
ncbi:MAG: hypothetical protein ACK4YU_15145, partial [Paracoccus sp. (in: a-proteobacteria)]